MTSVSELRAPKMSGQCSCLIFILICGLIQIIAQNISNETCGIQTSDNQYPWVVGIEFKTKSELIIRIQCTGALISRTHVISNAECYSNLYRGEPRKSVHLGPNITIIAGKCLEEGGKGYCKEDGSIRVPIEMLILHPEYDDSQFFIFEAASYYDIAIIKLREVVPYTDSIRPICLPSADIGELTEIDRDLYIAGVRRAFPDAKVHASLTYLNRTTCGKNILAEDEMCATDTEVKPLCLYQGGLVMNKLGDKYELLGLVTRRSLCNTPRVFINLFSHLDWIRSNMTGWTRLTGGCGKRKRDHIELIINAEATKVGDWPWHVAIYRLQTSSIKYICGGTLISKTMIITAAHCVTINGIPANPEILSVILGKYNLIGRDMESQEREVFSVIAHENFSPMRHFENDIALLKLRNEATYTDYVQPACIWSSEANDRLPSNRDFGMVVGWGIDQSEQLSSQLKQANLPRVSELTCVRKNPLFYSKILENNKTFCAGWANGTSPCNGDSGGGFLVFVPDSPKDDSADALGSWYVRGIVSITAYLRNKGRCDPYQYVIFTDIDKYTDWIQNYLIL